MSYKTFAVELKNGHVTALGQENLPEGRALLTFIQPNKDSRSASTMETRPGLRRFLAGKDFSLTPEQFKASMEADYFEQ